MVMPWSRSDWKASIRKAHSKGIPRRSHMARIASSLPSGSEPVSWKSRPTSEDLPWSTWPTMTARNCSRPAPSGERRGAPEARAALAAALGDRGALILHVPVSAKPLEGVLAFMVHGPARALGRAGYLQLGDDFVDGPRRAGDGEGDVLVAEGAIALAVLGEIEVDHRHLLPLGVAPDVDLRPMKQGMDAQMVARRQMGVEEVPEFRWLVAEVPLTGIAARAEDALLGANAFLVAANAGDDTGESELGDRRLETCRLARG